MKCNMEYCFFNFISLKLVLTLLIQTSETGKLQVNKLANTKIVTV